MNQQRSVGDPQLEHKEFEERHDLRTGLKIINKYDLDTDCYLISSSCYGTIQVDKFIDALTKQSVIPLDPDFRRKWRPFVTYGCTDKEGWNSYTQIDWKFYHEWFEKQKEKQC